MKKLIYLLIALTILGAGCKKDGQKTPPGNNSGIQISVVKGIDQKDTVGNLLKDTILVKVRENGVIAQNYTVRFIRSGCEDIKVVERKLSNGYARYPWFLSGEVGTQLLKIIVLDNNGNKKDSIKLKASAIAATNGWHRSGCVQNFPVGSISKSGEGRLFASLNEVTYPYYSDNNAVSWHPLTSFPNTYFITKIIGTAGNELFLATQNSGIFYSPDAGRTWVNRTAGITDPTGFTDVTYTKSGRLIFCTGNGVYFSKDKGLTWTDISFGLPPGKSTYPCESITSALLIIGSDAQVYKSNNLGVTWINQATSIGNPLLASVESLYVDMLGKIYIGVPHNGAGTNGEIYYSDYHAVRWIKVFSKPSTNSSFPNITQIGQLRGEYYFSFAGRGVYKTLDFHTFKNVAARFADNGLLTYTVAGNTAFVVGSPGFGIFYYKE